MNGLQRLLMTAGLIVAAWQAARRGGRRIPYAALLLWGVGCVVGALRGVDDGLTAESLLWMVFGWGTSVAFCGVVAGVSQTARRVFWPSRQR